MTLERAQDPKTAENANIVQAQRYQGKPPSDVAVVVRFVVEQFRLRCFLAKVQKVADYSQGVSSPLERGAVNRAVSAGGRVAQDAMGQMQDQFWGDRSGTFTDPHGYTWTIATHKEDLAPEEMKQRMNEFMKNFAGAQATH